jgi:hypothetical protein
MVTESDRNVYDMRQKIQLNLNREGHAAGLARCKLEVHTIATALMAQSAHVLSCPLCPLTSAPLFTLATHGRRIRAPASLRLF